MLSTCSRSYKKIAVAALLAFFAFAPAAENLPDVASHCGTMHAVIKRQKNKGKMTAARKFTSNCEPEAYYDTVYTRKTKHFEIFYTLNGVHATTAAFVDSVAASMEKAWDHHVGKLGMKKPIGGSVSYHFQKNIDSGLYPVEIVDLYNVRNASVVGTDQCTAGCFGITHPTDYNDPQKTEIVLDNDFYYVPINASSLTYDSVTVNDDICKYAVATAELKSVERSYVRDWGMGIRVTAFHELYHAVQLRYMSVDYWSFWFEASASGIEEVAAPDVDDYISHVGSVLRSPGLPLDNYPDDYGLGILYIYLYFHFDAMFDKKIWEGFAKDPNTNFQGQLSKVLRERNLSADSVFHDFSTKISFAGKRSLAVDSNLWINADQPKWPEALFKEAPTAAPDMEKFSFQYYTADDMDFSSFKGKASAVQYSNGKATITPIINTSTLDKIRSQSLKYDSLVWVFSRFADSDYIPEVVKDSTLRAYPTPWRNGNLCFTPLPKGKKFIEIRNRRGDLVMRENYTHSTHCIDESTVKAKMVPGLYRFRAGAHGRSQDMMIIY